MYEYNKSKKSGGAISSAVVDDLANEPYVCLFLIELIRHDQSTVCPEIVGFRGYRYFNRTSRHPNPSRRRRTSPRVVVGHVGVCPGWSPKLAVDLVL